MAMALPSTLLDLALMLRAEPDGTPAAHVATLAARLGYRSVWLPLPADDLETAAQVDALTAAAHLRVGVVLSGSDDEVARWLADVAARRPDLLISVSAARAKTVGAARLRPRIFSSEFDPDAAGCLIRASDRAAAVAAVRHAVAS